MTNNIQIDINERRTSPNVMQEVTQDINGMEQSASQSAEATSKMSGGVVSLNAALEISRQVGGLVVDIYKESVGATLEYSNQVRTLRDVTGQSAESSSRLLQVLDDYKISADDLTVASKKLTKEGLELNIQTLADLSDRYLDLNSGQERAEFLMDNFGKQGMKFAEIMLQGSDAILQMNDSIDENLILTDESLEQAREYEKNLDELNDTWLSLKITLGSSVLPVMNDVLEGLNNSNEIRAEANRLIQEGIAGNREEALSLAEANVERLNASKAVLDHGEALMGTVPIIEQVTEITEEMAKARSEYYTNVLSGAEKYYDVNQRFIEQQENLKTKQQEVKAEIDTLISQGWSPYSDKVQGLQGEYDNLGVKIEEAAQKHREKLAEMQYNLLLAKLSADGLTDAEYAIATAAGVAFGVFDQEAADAQMAQMELTNAVAEGRLRVEDYGSMMKSAMSDGVVSASELQGMIDSIPTEKTVTVNVIGRGMESLRNTSYWNSEKGNGYAKGTDGWMTVPSGYPNDSYPILLTSGERFAVIPNGVQASPSPAGGFGGGGGVNVTLVIQSPVNLSTEEQAKNVLMPFIESGISELVSRGVIPNVYQ